MFSSIDASMSAQASAIPGGGGGDFDEMKRMIIETNPILLVTTILVTLLHSLFEFLAFKSDISSWKGKKNLTGVSVRSIFLNIFVQLVILLYLLDNSTNTSTTILAGQGVGLAIEAWKITKVLVVKVVPTPPGSWLPFKVIFTDKHVLSEDEKKTQV